MKKIILSLAAILAVAFSAAADIHTLVVHTTDGNTAEFLFEATPVATFDDANNMTIVTNNGADRQTFLISDVKEMSVKKESNAVMGVTLATPKFRIDGETLLASGLKAGTSMEIFDNAGKRLFSVKADANGNAAHSLSGIAQGVYVVRAAKFTFKFIK